MVAWRCTLLRCAADTQDAKTWQSRISLTVKQSGHVRHFLLVAADVRHKVGFLEAVQDNVAADEQEHIFELVYFDSVHAVIFWQCTIRLLCDSALGVASNNVKKELESCTPDQPPLLSRHEPLGDSRLSLSATSW